MHGFASCILMLTGPGIRDRENLTAGFPPHEIYTRIFHRHFASQISVHPFHGPLFFHACTFRYQVIDVIAPILDRGVTDTGAFFDNNFYNCGMK